MGGKNTLLAEAPSGRPHLYYQATTSTLTQQLEDSAADRLPGRLQFDAVGPADRRAPVRSDPRVEAITAVGAAIDYTLRDILRRLARKGWLQRTAKGRYEPLLADTGGWAVPNAWAALSTWGVPYYVGFASAAHELGLTPDRPGSVQTCVAVGAKRPRAWVEIPITLVPLRSFTMDGTEEVQLHGFLLQVAQTEKVLLDGAATPARVGGVIGLTRILDRAINRTDWHRFVRLASDITRGGAAARRLASIAELIGYEVPDVLAAFASERAPSGKHSVIYLDDRSLHGRRGTRLERWKVIANLSTEALREEVRR